ncbi:hypothetical protein [Blastococcus sp. DSM 46786]|uniref:hypothetical protein n=1 Tax=Blastococcus sp. DSM 46786 TaxID=1798227 RepID=UPI001114441C|nr:hypothetical protein [Blastococcus sp. DSM 46786]
MTGLLVVLLGIAVSGAAPARAVDDPTRPDARVTHGPSCRPGGIVVEVVAGNAPYSVVLATVRTPSGEDEAVLEPFASVVLRTGDVAPGETIDPRLVFTARDGSGPAFVDELADYTLTRPTVEDCEAAMSPPPPPPAPPTARVEAAEPAPPPSAGSGTGTPHTPGTTTAPAPTTGRAGAPTSPEPTTGGRAPRTSDAAGAVVPAGSVGGGAQVQAGGTVVLRGAGFIPGERVDVLLHGGETVLASATADPAGEIRVDVRIPETAAAGPATLDLVGADSAVGTSVALQVAAAAEEAATARGVLSLASLTIAAVALVATAAGLVSVAGRQHAGRRAVGSVSAG